MNLSVVCTTREDGHGGDQVARMHLFARSIAKHSLEFDIPVELFIVNWNPPDGAPPIGESGLFAAAGKHLVTRVITVPVQVHGSIENSEKMPIFQMIAKNVGIRRAGGDWILCTNPDVVFSRECFEQLAADPDPEFFYRVPREDVHSESMPPADMKTDKAIAWMRNRQTSRRDELWEHGLFTMACGDFTLCHRSVWHRMYGYPEYALWSPHNDSLFLGQLWVHGYEQVIWSHATVYHIDHPGSLSADPDYGAQKQLPQIDFDDVSPIMESIKALREKMLSIGSGINPTVTYNDDAWGLAYENLEEVVL